MQKDANLVELEKCCRTHIFLHNFVLIQPRTSPPKICKKLLIYPILLTLSKFATFPNELAAQAPLEEKIREKTAVLEQSAVGYGAAAILPSFAPGRHLVGISVAER